MKNSKKIIAFKRTASDIKDMIINFRLNLIDTITRDFLQKAVVVRGTNQIYGKKSIQEWFNKKRTCPKTNIVLKKKRDEELIPLPLLDATVSDWRDLEKVFSSYLEKNDNEKNRNIEQTVKNLEIKVTKLKREIGNLKSRLEKSKTAFKSCEQSFRDVSQKKDMELKKSQKKYVKLQKKHNKLRKKIKGEDTGRVAKKTWQIPSGIERFRQKVRPYSKKIIILFFSLLSIGLVAYFYFVKLFRVTEDVGNIDNQSIKNVNPLVLSNTQVSFNEAHNVEPKVAYAEDSDLLDSVEQKENNIQQGKSSKAKVCTKTYFQYRKRNISINQLFSIDENGKLKAGVSFVETIPLPAFTVEYKYTPFVDDSYKGKGHILVRARSLAYFSSEIIEKTETRFVDYHIR